MSNWIYCRENLPPYGVWVLLSAPDDGTNKRKNNVLVGRRSFTDEQGEHYVGFVDRAEVNGVYAWMLIPEPAVRL